MAGHSQFKNIMHRKGAQDRKRGQLFNKIAREITVAAKSGLPDPAANPRLRAAIAAARAQNMPNDRVKRAIEAATGGADARDYKAARYEGYGPGGVAIIIEALTDNFNRTVSDLRATIGKNGGTLGEANSVSFQFDHVGSVWYPLAIADADTMFEAALDAGAENVISDAEGHEILCSTNDFAAVRDALETRFGTSERGGLIWKPKDLVPVSGEAAQTLLKLLDLVDDLDDVQTVISNADIAEEELLKMAG